ncbi:MAG: S-layer homology domain-containing protein [Oscillospiraceae bacterium]|nr:S-layer homology domain-containing protein [Oscillospiraceae bacterium]
MKKKLLKNLGALLLAIVMLMTTLSTVFAAAGTDAAPQTQPITRGAFARLVADSFQLSAASGTPSFTDVPAGHQHAAAIAAVHSSGYMVGNSAGRFFPDQLITGWEAATMINNMLGFDGDLAPQASGLSVPSWAVPAASVLLDLTMVDRSLIERHQMMMHDAEAFIDAVTTALMIAPGTPYALQQVGLRDNFFAYVNRQFLATGTFHPGAVAAMSFSDVSQKVREQQQVILYEILTNTNLAPGSDEWMARELHTMFLDNEARIASISLLEPYFDAVRDADSIDELLEVARRYSHYFSLVPFYSLAFARDARVDATQWAAFIMPSGLSLGSRDLYADDPSLAHIHTAYIEMLAEMLMHIGETEDLEDRAAALFAVEQARALRMLPAAAAADPQVLFTPTTWQDVLEASSVTQSLTFIEEIFELAQDMNVYSAVLDYVEFINSLYVEENLQTLKDAALIHIFSAFMPVLDDAFANITDGLLTALLGQAMSDGLTIEDRAQQFVTSMMWRTFSRAYYQRFSSPELKRDVTEMTEEIRAVMGEMIADLTWMSAETRAASIEKLEAVTAFIAFPDEPISELPFEVRPQALGGNLVEFMFSSARLSNELSFEQISNPAIVNIWESLPTSTVNAFYSAMDNAIIIPAGILQYPFYSTDSTREQNLGAIGAVIAHEFVHAFDPMGSQFDKHGTMTNWWTEADSAAFAERNARVIEILNSIEFAGMNIDGAFTVGEAVTDLGAMEVALTVAAGMEDADPALVMKAWARIWAARMSPEVANFMMLSAPHLPPLLRTNFILAQLDEFYEVFGVVAGDGMYIPVDERISFWR